MTNLTDPVNPAGSSGTRRSHLRAVPNDASGDDSAVDLYPQNAATGRRSLSIPRVAERVAELLDVRVVAGEPRAYSKGAWAAHDNTDVGPITEATRDLLGDGFNQKRLSEVMAYLGLFAPRLPAQPHNLIVYSNATLDIDTGELLDHSPEHQARYRLDAELHHDADPSIAKGFLSEGLPEEFLKVAWEAIGYAMSCWRDLHALVWAWGPPASGKSTLLRAIQAAFGPRNYAGVSPQSLAESQFRGAALSGKLLNAVGDVSARDVTSLALLKSITGQDDITIESKFRDPITTRIEALMWFCSNTLPTMSDPSGSMQRRVVPLEFERSPGRATDPRLTEKLIAPDNLAGFAFAAMAGLYRLRQQGSFTTNDRIEQARQAFRNATNTVAGFVSEVCVRDPDGQVRTADLWRLFQLWASRGQKGQKTSRNTFHATVRDMPGIDTGKSNGTPVYRGIRLAGELR